MGDNLPVVHDQDKPPNPRKAESEDEAIHIGNYHQDRTIAIGNQEKQEWIIAPESYNLEDMR